MFHVQVESTRDSQRGGSFKCTEVTLWSNLAGPPPLMFVDLCHPMVTIYIYTLYLINTQSLAWWKYKAYPSWTTSNLPCLLLKSDFARVTCFVGQRMPNIFGAAACIFLQVCLLVAAEFDAQWAKQQRPDPQIKPRSHAARIRLDSRYDVKVRSTKAGKHDVQNKSGCYYQYYQCFFNMFS